MFVTHVITFVQISDRSNRRAESRIDCEADRVDSIAHPGGVQCGGGRVVTRAPLTIRVGVAPGRLESSSQLLPYTGGKSHLISG